MFELVGRLRSRCYIGCDKLFVGSRTRSLEVDTFAWQANEKIGCVCVPTVAEVHNYTIHISSSLWKLWGLLYENK